jgi:AcrR family transcriptional regulator
MLLAMGRPRQHDYHTASALLLAAERIVESEGLDALTVRRVASEVGTTTRAVYSVFGSKDALLVALGEHGFDMLRERIEAMRTSADPAIDLIEAGVTVFRPFAIDHPVLFQIGVQRSLPQPGLAAGFRDAAEEALEGLRDLVGRLDSAGLLGGRSVHDAVCAFHALCEGLAALELRSSLITGNKERVWRDSLTALVRGFALPSA